MANYHPDLHLLIEFSAGSLSPAVAVCVSAHLDYCTQCRNHVRKLEALGSAVMEQHAETENARALNEPGFAGAALDAALENTLAAIDALPDSSERGAASQATAPDALPADNYFPASVKKLCYEGARKLRWKKISAALSIAHLGIGDTRKELALHRLHAGGGVADHDHRGEEITVVLCGSFSDQHGLYQPGDFLVKQPGDVHSPRASKHGDCICLSALAAPVRFTGMLTRLLNPFIRLNTSAA